MSSASRRLALASTNSLSTSGGGERKQCWECQRRRLVCDATRPVCTKCQKAGVVCPGYEDKKPLTWLAPGKVKSRTWKRKPRQDKNDTSNSTAITVSETTQAHVTGQLIHIFPGTELRSVTCDVVEATLYWNEQVYPAFTSNQLASSPWIVPVTIIHYLPLAIQHALVSMAIDHRMHRLSQRKNDPLMTEVRARFHMHRSTAIRALNYSLLDSRLLTTDATMASVMVFLYADLMGSLTVNNWRHHLSGLAAMVAMRGGYENMYRAHLHLHPLLLFTKLTSVLANTTSPADDLYEPIEAYENRDIIIKLYSTGYYPCLPCPNKLLLGIISINRLRHLVATEAWPANTESPQTAAEQLLDAIIEFSPESWVEEKTEMAEEFLHMAQTYQSAVVLYALSSLQNLGVLPSSGGWKAVKTIHCRRLISLLDAAAESRVMRDCVIWPLIVAGFEAKDGGAADRKRVVAGLSGISRTLGVYLPLAAVAVLEDYWMSTRSGWDECFDKPYALIT